jgi:hypothetical protein
MKKIRLYFLIASFLLAPSCNLNLRGYPHIINNSKLITDQLNTFEIQPRTFSNGERVAIAIDLEGKLICLDRNKKFRLCSKELYVSQPPEIYLYPEKDANGNSKSELTEPQKEKQRILREAQLKNPWFDLVEKGPILEFHVEAIDSNGQVIPLENAGSSLGDCGVEDKGNICFPYGPQGSSIGEIKTLDGVIVNAFRIRTAGGNLSIFYICVIGVGRDPTFGISF